MNACYNMNMIMKSDSKQILNKFVSLLKTEFGFRITDIIEEQALDSSLRADAVVTAQIGRYHIPMLIEIKSTISHQAQLQRLIDYSNNNESGVPIVISSSISSKLKERLRISRIGFYEIDKSIYIPLEFTLGANGQSFSERNFLIKKFGFRTESNIKLLLYFVANPSSLTCTQRQLAQELDLSLGSINKSIKNLENLGLIKTFNERRYLGNFEDIVSRWRISLLDFERDSLLLGRFSPINESFYSNWTNIDISSADSLWGGEAAAHIRTKYLNPEKFNIYTYNDKPTKIASLLKLKRDDRGSIAIYKCFWPNTLNNNDNTSPDFITYCELLNSSIDRNIETAAILKNDLISKIGEYEY